MEAVTYETSAYLDELKLSGTLQGGLHVIARNSRYKEKRQVFLT